MTITSLSATPRTNAAVGPNVIAITAPYGPPGPVIAGTSKSANTIGLGALSFTLEEYNRSFFPGTRVRAAAASAPANYVEGIVTSFAGGTTVTLTSDAIGGSGSYSDWLINVAGQPGTPGVPGPTAPAGPVPEAAGDGKYYARRNAGWYETAGINDVTNKLPLAGGTLTGMLFLPATTPTDPNHAVRKTYVDTQISGAVGITEAPNDATAYARKALGWTRAVQLAGDTMTGALTLPAANPTAAAHAAHKGYVDAQISSVTSGYLLKTGGTITGTLTVAAQLNASAGAVYVYGYAGDNNKGSLYLNSGGSAYVHYNGTYLQLSHWLTALAIAPNGSVALKTNGDPAWVMAVGGDGVWRFGTDSGSGAIGTSHFELHVDSIWWLTTIASVAYKVGGGPWNDSSDARIKTVIGPYESGLAEIDALQPVRYTYKGNETRAAPEGEAAPYANSPHRHVAQAGTEFIGLVAQDCEAAMPEIVTNRTAYIDGMQVSDLRDLDTGPLVFALINAVKTLSARVQALEAAAGGG